MYNIISHPAQTFFYLCSYSSLNCLCKLAEIFFSFAGKNISSNNAKISPTKKSPMKMNNNLKPPSMTSNKSAKSSPARSPIMSIKSQKSNAESSPKKDASDTKSFIAFTEVLDENQLNEEVCEKSQGGSEESKEGIEIVL